MVTTISAISVYMLKKNACCMFIVYKYYVCVSVQENDIVDKV